MKLNACGIIFSKPKGSDFGAVTSCKGILKIKFAYIPKNLGWFLKHEENNSNITWCDAAEIASLKIVPSTTVNIGKFIIDGSHPIDDLELPLKNTLFGVLKNTCSIVEFSKSIYSMVNLTGESKNTQQYVLTKDCTPEIFIKEVYEHLTVSSYSEFKRAFDWLTKKRYERDILTNQREMLAKLSKNSPRSAQGFDASIMEYYLEVEDRVGRKASYNLTEFLPFSNQEAIDYFFFISGNKYEFVSSRLIQSMCNGDHVDFEEDNIKIVGYLQDSISRNLLLYHNKYNKTYYNIEVKDSSYDLFDMTIVDSVNENTVKSGVIAKLDCNIASASKVIETIQTKLNLEDTIPGTIQSLTFKELLESINLICGITETGSYGEYRLHQIREDVKCNNGFSNYSAIIQINNTDNKFNSSNVRFNPGVFGINDFTHNSIDSCNQTLDNIMVSLPKISKKTDGSTIEIRKEALAERIATLYSILDEYVKNLIIYCLDVKSIDRPYLVLEKTELGIASTAKQYNQYTSGSAKKADCLTYDSVKSEVIPDFRCLPLLMSIKGILKTWPNVFETLNKIAESVKIAEIIKPDDALTSANPVKAYSYTYLFMKYAYEEICRNNLVTISSLFDSGHKIKSVEYTIKKQYKINLSLIDKYSIFNLLAYCSIYNMVENDTFINVGNDQDAKLISNKDIIHSVLRDNRYQQFKLLRSIYDKPRIQN